MIQAKAPPRSESIPILEQSIFDLRHVDEGDVQWASHISWTPIHVLPSTSFLALPSVIANTKASFDSSQLFQFVGNSHFSFVYLFFEVHISKIIRLTVGTTTLGIEQDLNVQVDSEKTGLERNRFVNS